MTIIPKRVIKILEEGISGKQKDRVIYNDVLIIAITKYVTS
jgi:hypothetical protein